MKAYNQIHLQRAEGGEAALPAQTEAEAVCEPARRVPVEGDEPKLNQTSHKGAPARHLKPRTINRNSKTNPVSAAKIHKNLRFGAWLGPALGGLAASPPTAICKGRGRSQDESRTVRTGPAKPRKTEHRKGNTAAQRSSQGKHEQRSENSGSVVASFGGDTSWRRRGEDK